MSQWSFHRLHRHHPRRFLQLRRKPPSRIPRLRPPSPHDFHELRHWRRFRFHRFLLRPPYHSRLTTVLPVAALAVTSKPLPSACWLANFACYGYAATNPDDVDGAVDCYSRQASSSKGSRTRRAPAKNTKNLLQTNVI